MRKTSEDEEWEIAIYRRRLGCGRHRRTRPDRFGLDAVDPEHFLHAWLSRCRKKKQISYPGRQVHVSSENKQTNEKPKLIVKQNKGIIPTLSPHCIALEIVTSLSYLRLRNGL